MNSEADICTQETKESLKAFCAKKGALVTGVAAAAAFDDAPEGFRPGDLLPKAKSVIVIGGSPPRAGDWMSPKKEHMETVSTADRITSAGMALAKHIEAEYGYYALCAPPGTDKNQQPFMSIAMAAEKTGCASPSLAGPMLHPEFGMLYLAAVLTTLPLPPDHPSETNPCPADECIEMWKDKGTTPCISVCSIKKDGCIGGRIEEGRITDRSFDNQRCTARVYNYWIPGYQDVLAAALDEEDKDKRKMILYGSFFTRTLWSITYSNAAQGQCFECMRVCPVGRKSRTKK